MLLFSREHRVNWVGNTSPGAGAGQEEAEGPCRAARAPRVLLEDAKCLLEQPSSSGVRTMGNPSLHPRGFCVAGNPNGCPREFHHS